MSAPLILTLSRILLGPIFLVVYLYHDAFGIEYAMASLHFDHVSRVF